MHRMIVSVPMLALGCGLSDDIIDFGEVVEYDERPVFMAEDPPPPISGGTLLVLDDEVAVAADADRDTISVVDLAEGEVRRTFALAPGSEPGRLVEGELGRIHVLLRGTGQLASFDHEKGEVVVLRALCVDPRGIDYDAVEGRLLVACADGDVLALPEDPSEGGVVDRRHLEPDLRDVVVREDRLLLSRFRSAQVLEVPLYGDGEIVHHEPESIGGFAPTSMWRMIDAAPDLTLGLHQYASLDPLLVAPTDAPAPPDPPYGGGGGESCLPAVVGAAVTTWSAWDVETRLLRVPTPAVDVAFLASLELVAVAVPAVADSEHNVDFLHLDPHKCADFATTSPGQVVAVAFTRSGRLVTQSREPAQLNVHRVGGPFDYSIRLAQTTVFDTGHDLFHRATPAEIACASCHGEGTDDGHVWSFVGLGSRRTQPLDVGLENSEPLHWDGDIADIRELTGEVLHRRMGGLPQRGDRVEAFERWLFSLARPAAGSRVDPGLADEGYELFHELGCASCHAGSRLSNDLNMDIAGLSLQVPSLRRVGLRPPYMHDGRSADLREAVVEMIVQTRPDLEPEDALVDSLVAFLRTQ